MSVLLHALKNLYLMGSKMKYAAAAYVIHLQDQELQGLICKNIIAI